MAICAELENDYEIGFPNLKTSDHQKTSERDDKYNCIAWIFGAQDKRWWPVDADEAFWPRPLDFSKSHLEALIELLLQLGFTQCSDGSSAPSIEKVAVYVGDDGDLSHAAIYKISGPDTGYWSSKIGQNVDIRHKHVTDIEGPRYGAAKLFFSRQLPMAEGNSGDCGQELLFSRKLWIFLIVLVGLSILGGVLFLFR